MGESHRATNRAVTSSSVFSRRPRPRQCFGNKALMPPWHRAHFSRSQSRLRCLRHEERRRQRNGAAAHLRAAVERIALRGPRRSLRIEWLRYNTPSLAAGQAPWYRLILFGEEGYGNWGYPLDGYTVIVVGAALIKNYSSYVQNKKSSTCFFPKTGARGPETTPRQVADASPLLADFVE